ncbi:hypothetical protein [Rhizobium rhizogenes]|uniref:hypothetical protein n=1 Tax=Rhizobium rhizogenes TaxID=359 RepID=UPI001571BA7F|nr:hypothetical protein [Rhizobium rhizogenes]NTF79410.1 hypothetical protein [Rhizobium rhizogenes]
MVGDVEQSITGMVSDPGLVQLLNAGGMSADDALTIQNLIDIGAVVVGVAGAGREIYSLAKPASSLTSAERSLINRNVLTLDEAAAQPRVIFTSDGQQVTLPSGYKPLSNLSAAGDVGGLPAGFVRVTDNKGNIVIAGPNGAIYGDVASAQLAAAMPNTVPITKAKFGHTFDNHGQEATNFLTQRAKGSNQPQGQFLDDQAAANFIQDNLDKTRGGAISLPVPDGLAVRVINPDGSYSPAKTIRLVPGGRGVKTAYPEP